MAHKFILNNGFIKLGNVNYHEELAQDHNTTKGGGLWDMDEQNNILYLWGSSSEYGPAQPEDIEKCFKSVHAASVYRGYTIMHSEWLATYRPRAEKFKVVCIVP